MSVRAEEGIVINKICCEMEVQVIAEFTGKKYTTIFLKKYYSGFSVLPVEVFLASECGMISNKLIIYMYFDNI